MSGGACFTPRLDPRPEYPSGLSVYAHAVWHTASVVFLCAAFTVALQAPFVHMVSSLNQVGWTEQQIFTLITLAVHTGCYVGINGFFFACAKMRWLSQFQFDRKPFQVPTRWVRTGRP